jgi:hypothetical protein
VDADQWRFGGGKVAHPQHDGLFDPAVVERGPEAEDPEVAELGREVRFGNLLQPKRGGIVHAAIWEPYSFYYNGFRGQCRKSTWSRCC